MSSNSPSEPSQWDRVRRVGTFTAGCILVSNMIGTGIFSSTGFLARDLGSPAWILLLWLLGGAYALLGATCYAELGASIPKAGGEYAYIRRAFGERAGFLSGWASMTIGFPAAVALNVHLFAEHLRELVPALANSGGAGEWIARFRVVELGTVFVLTGIHLLGVIAGGQVQRVLTVVKVGAVLALIAAAVTSGRADLTLLGQSNASVTFDGGTALVAFFFVTFSYSGWNAVSYIAGEVREPGRSIPRATLMGTLLVTGLYLALNVVYLSALPVEEMGSGDVELVGMRSAIVLLGPGAGRGFTALLLVSILGASSAMIWAGPRVTFAMARDGVLPERLGKRAEGSGAPVSALLLQGGWICVLVVLGTFESLVNYSMFVLVLFAGLGVASLPVLRRREPGLERPYRARLYPLAPALFVATSVTLLWAAVLIKPEESLLGLATVAAGLPLRAWFRRRASRSGSAWGPRGDAQ